MDLDQLLALRHVHVILTRAILGFFVLYKSCDCFKTNNVRGLFSKN